MTSHSDKERKEKMEEYYGKDYDPPPTLADNLLIALLHELKRTGILSQKELMRITSQTAHTCEDTPVYDTEGFKHTMIHLLELAGDPGILATIAKARREREEGKDSEEQA